LLRMISPALLIPITASEVLNKGHKASDAKQQHESLDGVSDGRFPWEPAALFFTFLVVGATYYKLSRKTKDGCKTRVHSPHVEQDIDASSPEEINDDGCASSPYEEAEDDQPADPATPKSMDVVSVKKMLLEYAKSNKEKKETISDLNKKVSQLENALKQATEQLAMEASNREELERKVQQLTES